MWSLAGLPSPVAGIGGRRRPDLDGGPLPGLLLTLIGRFEEVSRPESMPASTCSGAQGAVPREPGEQAPLASGAKHRRRASCRGGLRG
jgi:hypothetical protein